MWFGCAGYWSRGESAAAESLDSRSAVCCGDVCDGYMAVFLSPLDAPQQVHVQARALAASPTGGAFCIWSAVQPPLGRPAAGHCGRRHLLPGDRDDSPDVHLLLLIRNYQDHRRPLWAVVAIQPLPVHFLEQHCLPRHPPPVAWHQVQLLPAVFHLMG
jgi:hypothetical protein